MRRRREGEEGMGGQAACALGVGWGAPSGSETARAPELDGGKERGSVIKCARAATQAGERTRPGICSSTLPVANASKTGGRRRAAD